MLDNLMRIASSKSGGRAITGDTPYGKFSVTLARSADNKPLKIVDVDGNEVGEAHILFREPIPADTTPEQEKRRAKAGGCCGQSSE